MIETPTAVASRRDVMAVLPALMLAILLAMLDNMIVSTAMPRIVGDLHGLSHLSWVVTAYVLGTTVSTPLWGKIGDLYGRKSIFLTSVVIFLIGSALSGAAQSMDELIGFRALQGLGAGGLLVGVMAIIGDLVPPRERGRAARAGHHRARTHHHLGRQPVRLAVFADPRPARGRGRRAHRVRTRRAAGRRADPVPPALRQPQLHARRGDRLPARLHDVRL